MTIVESLRTKSMFRIFCNPVHRVVIAWTWIAIMSMGIALIAARQIVMTERQTVAAQIDTLQYETNKNLETRIERLEVWQAAADVRINASLAHSKVTGGKK